MHIRAGAKGSVGFVIFKEKLFLETLDLQTSRVSEAKSLPRMSESGQIRTLGIYSAETSVGPLRPLKVAGGATPGSSA
jgi:hypothetical protein